MNMTALRTLFAKEIRRFGKVWMQTLFSPLTTTALYFLVFGVALGGRLGTMEFASADGTLASLPYALFVVPGLMMLSMINNSFLNTSSSLFQSKINGTLVDLLTAPLGATEILLSYVGAAVVRGLIVGALVYLVAGAFVGFHMAHPLWVAYFSLTVTTTFAAAGLLAAIWAEKFDQLSIFPNFVVQPLTFLGGVFYVVTDLPPLWETVSRFNPILYTVCGLRFGITGASEISVGLSAALVGAACLVSVGVCWLVLRSGWRIRR